MLIESSDEDRSGVREDDQLSGEGDRLTGQTSRGEEQVKAPGTGLSNSSKDLGCSVEIELKLFIWLLGQMNRDEMLSGLSILCNVK